MQADGVPPRVANEVDRRFGDVVRWLRV